MASTFFGLHIGTSGLNAFHAAVNTTAHNISNLQTEGYSKQVVNMEASNAQRTYQRNGTTGLGVTAVSVTQARDQYYDVKYWSNQSKYGEYDAKYYYMEQIENYFTDDENVEGFTRLYSKMFNSLDSVKNSAGDTSVRNQFISHAKEVLTYFNTMSNRLSELQSICNDEIKSTVGNVNSIIEKIASINKQINTIELEGGHANELRDKRALLIDELSEIVPVEVNETKVENSYYEEGKTPRELQYTGGTLFTVKLNGRLLVDTYTFTPLATETRQVEDNQSDVEGLYEVVWSDSGAKLGVNAYSMSGSLKALFQIRDGNNNENLTGRVVQSPSPSNQIRIDRPSITDIKSMNMPEKGRLMINNTQFDYDGFTFETDEEGNITSYTFQLRKPIGADVARSIVGNTAENGDAINYKGIPYYQNQMNTFLRSFGKMFNDIEATGQYKPNEDTAGNRTDVTTVGYDYNGDPMGTFFIAKDPTNHSHELTFSDEIRGTIVNKKNTYDSNSDTYYRMTASNVDIAAKIQNDPKLFSVTTKDKNHPDGIDAYDVVEKLMTLKDDVTVFRGVAGSGFLECIYADVTVDTQQCKVFQENFENIREAISQQRDSVKGVDEDEEALDLVKFQNAYNLSSKVISVMNEMYDRLITQTGV